MAEVDLALPSQSCKKCDGAIYEGHAYDLGNDRWHIQCFKCFKCNKALGCNLNFLVLGNGCLVCSSCSYNCKQCGKKIDDLAVLTGDNAYCFSCFRCRVCKRKIEDLRYARTSKGLFCMSCHEDLLAKKKRELKRKQKEQLLLLRPATASTTAASSASLPSTSSLDSAMRKPPDAYSLGEHDLVPALGPPPDLSHAANLSSINKPLPPQPLSALASFSTLASLSTPSLNLAPSSTKTTFNAAVANITLSMLTVSGTHTPQTGLHESVSINSEIAAYSPDKRALYNIDPVKNDTDHLETIRKVRERLERRLERPSASGLGGAILDLIESFSGPTTPITAQIPLDALQLCENGSSNFCASPLGAALNLPLSRRARSPLGDDLAPGTHMYSNKSIMIISPSHFHNNEVHSANLVNLQTVLASEESVKKRSSISSPLAKVNRQARVVETLDDSSSSVLKDSGGYYLQSALTTPKKSTNIPGTVASAPPLLALPQLPNTPAGMNSSPSSVATARERLDPYEPKGIGLKSVELWKPTHTVKDASPAVANLEFTIPDSASDEELQKVSRSKSTRHKLLLWHKRSVSGGLSAGSLLSRLGSFRHKDDTEKGHLRHLLEGSINGQAFTTPLLPHSPSFGKSVYRELHNRSASETGYLTEADLAVESLPRTGLNQLEKRRQKLLADNMRLNSDRCRMTETISNLDQQISSEVDRLEALRAKISDLTSEKQRLKQENEALQERNNQLEAQILAHTRTQESEATPSPLTQAGNRASLCYEVNSDHLENLNAPDAVSEEAVETHKATRLKFWRRPKVSITSTGVNALASSHLSAHNAPNNILSNYSLSKMSLSTSSNSLYPSFNNSGNESNETVSAFKSLNSLLTKSRSTNILESFINGPGAGSEAPLLTSTIQKRAAYEGQKVPLIVTKCIEEVEKRGMDVEGIYRLSGGNSAVVAIENAFAALSGTDRKQLNKVSELLSGDINAVTSALKRYLRKLPDPLIPFALYSSYTKVGQNKGDTNERCQELQTRVILRLPAANKHAIYLIGKHLDHVNYYSSVNRMNFKNLSVVFAPTIARDPTGEREIADMGARNETTELLFANFATIFANYTSGP
ncbi:RhoGAP-domain-containing protein [Metschnikowia bicuspidata]|uniref:RhoGAP-domain-containing protein n=1 Tax=Metschnikowia bicuspidata TaxID=27322 RepID=A0A4P9ZG27_9ASCO|nr:RhoGAP-domain-containing protein [Metschnikowia bicuspidata]